MNSQDLGTILAMYPPCPLEPELLSFRQKNRPVVILHPFFNLISFPVPGRSLGRQSNSMNVQLAITVTHHGNIVVLSKTVPRRTWLLFRTTPHQLCGDNLAGVAFKEPEVSVFSGHISWIKRMFHPPSLVFPRVKRFMKGSMAMSSHILKPLRRFQVRFHQAVRG